MVETVCANTSYQSRCASDEQLTLQYRICSRRNAIWVNVSANAKLQAHVPHAMVLPYGAPPCKLDSLTLNPSRARRSSWDFQNDWAHPFPSLPAQSRLCCLPAPSNSEPYSRYHWRDLWWSPFLVRKRGRSLNLRSRGGFWRGRRHRRPAALGRC